MKITGEQLFFLIETLNDSLKLPMGTDWCFKNNVTKRKSFYEKFLQDLLTREKVTVKLDPLNNDIHL